MALNEKLNKLLIRYEELKEQLSLPMDNSVSFAKLSKEYSDLEEVVGVIKVLNSLKERFKEAETILKDPASDKEIKILAEEELLEVKKEIPLIERQIALSLIPKDIDDEKNIILEVRAGTGGEEAGLFAANLLRMYQRYAAIKGWSFELLGSSETGLGAIKEASASIKGKGVFSRLKFESGVHRVQRVPETEAGGRVHTSVATVAVLPEAEEVDVEILDKDLVIDVFRASGAGGQHVNTTDSAVRITHLPSGIVVAQQDERSQHKNKAKAMKILRAKLYERERAKRDSERAADRKSQVGRGERSERIRTYNFPQGRVTDHRINLTLYKIAPIMEGESLDELIDPLITNHQAELLGEI